MGHTRFAAIDILKCVAALFVVNSHMGNCYGPLSALSTGGAIGDALFFFCSGFCLANSNFSRFDNWYKRRLVRIYPAVLCWAFISALFWGRNMLDMVLAKDWWFIHCILCYYVILWFIVRFTNRYLNIIFWGLNTLIIVFYIIHPTVENYQEIMYSRSQINKFPYIFNFLFVLLGVVIARSKSFTNKLRGTPSLIILVLCLTTFYGILSATTKSVTISRWQVLSLIPLAGIVLSFLRLCNTRMALQIYSTRFIGFIIYFIGALCLEIYIVQGLLINPEINHLFPYNIIIIFTAILFAAYIVRSMSNFLVQTFNKGPYNWLDIFTINKPEYK